ncbi:MAG: hypothetical protein K2O24_01090 [Muribaculaceae bacterium]|nr:hypothetical protein [Muribaculaceae bacterium]
MIYIFEDRRPRAEENQDILGRYKDVAEFTMFDIDPDRDPEDYIIDKFVDADCVLLHKSYSFKHQEVNITKITDQLINANVKVGIYSGGIEKSYVDNRGVATLNAGVMYSNLEFFLKHYRDNGEILMELLVWGNRSALNRLLSTQVKIFLNYFVEGDLSQPLEDMDIVEDICDGFDEAGYEKVSSYILESIPSSETKPTRRQILEAIQSAVNIMENEL